MGKLILFGYASEGADPLKNIGLLLAGDVVANVTQAMIAAGLPVMRSMRNFLEMGDEKDRWVSHATASAQFHCPKSAIKLFAPIYDPEKIICMGMNYAEHCHEQNIPIPEEPILFSKFPSSISADGDPIPLAPEILKLDWEVEMCIVIGTPGRRIAKEDAMKHVAGYTVCHDVSARHWQLDRNGGQYLVGKTFDGFCPTGPAIVTPDEISDIHKIGVRTRVNGKTVQDSNTSELVFQVPDMIAWCSKFFTLKAGDMILTGTPSGVGCFLKPEPIFLKDGDVVDVEIDEIGTLTNQVVAESKLTSKL
jgi:2-keto-4-pentenoate hydratase/2-oxohepta-3-ene-1,7-dioic acid hydratase in catechol pathway